MTNHFVIIIYIYHDLIGDDGVLDFVFKYYSKMLVNLQSPLAEVCLLHMLKIWLTLPHWVGGKRKELKNQFSRIETYL